jgi:hypothetical protein
LVRLIYVAVALVEIFLVGSVLVASTTWPGPIVRTRGLSAPFSRARTGPCTGGSVLTVRMPISLERAEPRNFVAFERSLLKRSSSRKEPGHVVVTEEHPAPQLFAPVNRRLLAKP